MKVHAIQTGTVAVKRRQVTGTGYGPGRLIATLADSEWTEPLPILAWVIEHPEGLIVVDTGETSETGKPDYFPAWHPYHRGNVRIEVAPDEEIGPGMRRLGLSTEDVRWVVMTHLHTDHAGGLRHFPRAEILVSRTEFAAAVGFAGKLRGYLPHRWPHWFAPRPIDFPGSAFGPFPNSQSLTQAGDVQIVSAEGHSAGHLAVILTEGNGRLLFAGDASYTEQNMVAQAIDGVSPDADAARATLARIKRFAEAEAVTYLPSHDPESAVRLLERRRVVCGIAGAASPGDRAPGLITGRTACRPGAAR